MGAPNETYQVELKPSQMDYLVEMTRIHGLPDTSKALRCLITYAREHRDAEAEIFATMRCQDC
ncbi:MAG: hypothetical protein ACYTGC_02380 [Planctomycetota bacterium]